MFWAVSRPMYPETLQRLMASRNKTCSYIKTLHENLNQSAEALTLGPKMTFQKNKDLKHFAKSVKNGLCQSQELNAIKSL